VGPAAITAVNVALYAGSLWLFLERPFVGPDGKEARFMW
jgi:hypothetical protein